MTRDEALDLLVEVMTELEGMGPFVDRRRVRDAVEADTTRCAVYLSQLTPLDLTTGRLVLERAFARLDAGACVAILGL